MLGDKIYNLRKNRKISQEEFANILNTSRQAVSKWERNETKPDIDKLILIAKLFNISIDYLLNYEIDDSNVEDFTNKLEEHCKSNRFTISINDIKLWCSKYPNNFKLHVSASEYLFVAYIENNQEEYLDFSLLCIKKAIILYTPEYNDIINLNELYMAITEIYMMQHKYDLAKECIEMNKVYGSEVLLAKCDLALGKYDKALKTSSEIYLESTFNIINVSLIQIIILLKTKLVQEAYGLVDWTISFVNSVKNEELFFKGVLCPFIYLKAVCERLLNINSEESIKALKDIIDSSTEFNVISEAKSIKHYFGNPEEVLFIDSNIQNIFKEIIYQFKKDYIHYYVLIDIYNEVFRGDIND